MVPLPYLKKAVVKMFFGTYWLDIRSKTRRLLLRIKTLSSDAKTFKSTLKRYLLEHVFIA